MDYYVDSCRGIRFVTRSIFFNDNSAAGGDEANVAASTELFVKLALRTSLIAIDCALIVDIV